MHTFHCLRHLLIKLGLGSDYPVCTQLFLQTFSLLNKAHLNLYLTVYFVLCSMRSLVKIILVTFKRRRFLFLDVFFFPQNHCVGISDL